MLVSGCVSISAARFSGYLLLLAIFFFFFRFRLIAAFSIMSEDKVEGEKELFFVVAIKLGCALKLRQILETDRNIRWLFHDSKYLQIINGHKILHFAISGSLCVGANVTWIQNLLAWTMMTALHGHQWERSPVASAGTTAAVPAPVLARRRRIRQATKTGGHGHATTD